MKAERHIRGLMAEDEAKRLLEEAGCRILGQRIRTPAGEIDLLAFEAPDTCIIAEVKTRKTTDEGLFALSLHQRGRLLRAGEWLLANTHKFAGLADIQMLNIRFDYIVISRNASPLHLKNAWQAE